LVAAVVLGLASAARAQPCTGLVDAGPLLAGPGATDFGQVPEACGATDLFLRLRGELVLDKDDFYGVVTVGTTLRGRYRLSDRWSVSAAFDPATWRHPVNAVVSSNGVGVGPATLAVQRSFGWRRTELGVYARALLPLDTARHYGVRFGGELGVTASRRVRARGSVRAGLTVPATLVVIGGVGRRAFFPGALVEYAFAPRPWLALSAGAVGRVQLAPTRSLLAVAARAAVRMETRRGWHFGLAGDVPAGGTDRTDATVTLFVGRGHPRGDQ
jgi:hypothetical protein